MENSWKQGYVVRNQQETINLNPPYLWNNCAAVSVTGTIGSPYRAIYHFASEILAFVVLNISTNWYHMVKIAENDDM